MVLTSIVVKIIPSSHSKLFLSLNTRLSPMVPDFHSNSNQVFNPTLACCMLTLDLRGGNSRKRPECVDESEREERKKELKRRRRLKKKEMSLKQKEVLACLSGDCTH